MLNNIKSLILEKKSYMEAANLILEDTALDDSIVLDESPEEPEVDPVPEEQPEEVPAGTPAEQPAEDPAEITDLDPAAASELPNPADGNELPEPVAAPTGEPVSDDSVDLMTVEIDPVSNTVKDTIPVAPANAADAVEGEGEPAAQPVEQPVEPEAVPPVEATGDVENITSPEVPEENDADMMNDSLDDEPSAPTEEGPKDESAVESDPDSVDLMSESISIDDTPADDPAAAEAPADAGVEDLGTGEEPKQDNAVTAAVKDKVEELETQDEPAADTGAVSDGKEELMKKLSALTKSIEDAKALVMSKVQ